MSNTIMDIDTDRVEVESIGNDVRLEIIESDQAMRGYVNVRMSPGEAVSLSRALVKAAAEALDTEV